MDYMLLPLRRYFDFSGRSQRKEYWLFVLFQWLLVLPLLGLFAATGGDFAALAASPFALQRGGANAAVMVTGWIVLVALIIPMIAVQVRRLHDQDRSGWWILLSVVPFGELPLIAMMLFDGTVGGNRFGPDPKRRDAVHRRDWRDAAVDQPGAPQRPALGGGQPR